MEAAHSPAELFFFMLIIPLVLVILNINPNRMSHNDRPNIRSIKIKVDLLISIQIIILLTELSTVWFGVREVGAVQ